MKKYITILVIGLVCFGLAAEDTHRNFQSVDDLIATVKREHPGCVYYDTNRVIEGLELWPKFSTDQNLLLLSKIKSIRYLHIANLGGISSNAIPALAENPNLTGLCLVCCGGPKLDLGPLLPRLTSLQSLELAQTTYRPHDSIYLARMTNLTALVIAGYIPQPQVEVPPLTNLVNLRTLALGVNDEWISKVDTNIFSRLGKLTNFVVTSDSDRLPDGVWKTPAVNSVVDDTHRNFQGVDDLIAAVKKDCPVYYDTNGIIEGLELGTALSTDRNLRLLSNVKSIRYLLICNYNGISSNAVPILAEYPNLTGLGLVCCSRLGPLLPSLTNLQSLYLAQISYNTNDSIYLAKMTNLTALEILGRIPQTQAELLPLTNLVNLQTVVIWGIDKFIKNLDTNTFSKLGKLTNCFITSDSDLVPKAIWETPVWKTPPKK